MIEERDAFGRMLLDCLEGIESREIIERDDGYIDTGGQKLAYFSKFEEWMAHEQEAIHYCQGRVLDIGCGAGRHSLYLQERGFDVHGIDVSPLAVEVCRRRGLAHVSNLSITRLSARLGEYDTILMLGNNFGLMANWPRAKWLLRRMYKMTSNRGRIIASTLDPYQTDNPDHLAYHQRNRDSGRMSGQVRIRARYRNLIGSWFDYLFVSKEEMSRLLADSGWIVNRFIDGDGPLYAAIIDKAE